MSWRHNIYSQFSKALVINPSYTGIKSWMMDIHKKNLQTLCRICCKKLDKARRCKEVKLFSNVLLEHFSVDINQDSEDIHLRTNIHPTYVRERCRKILIKIENFPKNNTEGTVYRPQLTFFGFKQHSNTCDICLSCNKSKKGGRPPLRAWTNRHNIDNTLKVNVIGTKEEESSLFDVDLVIEHSQKLGFAYIPTENFLSFVMFYKGKGVTQFENIATINIVKNTHNWNVFVGEKDVSENKAFEAINSVLSSDSALELLTLCSNLNFCVGNEDFSKLCQEKSKKDGRVAFHDRSNNVIASQVKDPICKMLGLDSTIRHINCELISVNKRCIQCNNYRPTLRALQAKLDQNKNKHTDFSDKKLSSSFVNNRYLNRNELISKLDDRKKEIHNLSVMHVCESKLKL